MTSTTEHRSWDCMVFPQPVNGLQSGVARCIIADGVAGTGNVIVNGTRNPNHRDTVLGQGQKTVKGAVPANTNNGIQPQQFAGGNGLLLPLLSLELLAAGGVEYGASPAVMSLTLSKSSLAISPLMRP